MLRTAFFYSPFPAFFPLFLRPFPRGKNLISKEEFARKDAQRETGYDPSHAAGPIRRTQVRGNKQDAQRNIALFLERMKAEGDPRREMQAIAADGFGSKGFFGH